MRRLKGRRLFVSASVSKAVMLAAYLRRHAHGVSPSGRALLRRMITLSDNNAADAVYSSLGPGVIERTAKRAGAGSIDVRGWWTETYLSAAAGARFMSKIRRVIPGPRRHFAMHLLAHIVSWERWGIPDGIGPGWDLYFKGGWRGTGRGQLVHQIAVLYSGKRKISLAILTDGDPSMSYGIATLEGIARRLVPAAP
jgi:beta-lactamase class A